MAHIVVSTVLAAPPGEVWADLSNIASHVEWMADAASIRFTSDRTDGPGTTFDCETRVGPLSLTDHMEITRWEPGRRMGVRHVGIVTGAGEFRLKPLRRGRTKFTWDERLVFPWWMGGVVGSVVAAPVLKAIWRRNLRNLADRFT